MAWKILSLAPQTTMATRARVIILKIVLKVDLKFFFSDILCLLYHKKVGNKNGGRVEFYCVTIDKT